MSDLDTYLNHCYDLILKTDATAAVAEDEELCACANLVEHDEQHNQPR